MAKSVLSEISDFFSGGQESKSRKEINKAIRLLKKMPESEYANIATDPAYTKAMADALAQMTEVSREGFTEQDRAQMAQIEADRGAKERAYRETAASNARARGAGTGMEFFQQLIGQQQGAQEANLRGLQTAAEAANRRTQAAGQVGQMGSAFRGQQFGEQEAIARARDAREQFNRQARASLYGTKAQTAAQQGASNKALLGSGLETLGSVWPWKKG